MTWLAAHFPNSLVWFFPARGSSIGYIRKKFLRSSIDSLQLFAQQVNSTQEFSVNIDLALIPGAIANPNRTTASPA
jgi:hypothetical protein